MPNVIYPKYAEAVLNGTSGTSLSSGTVKAAMIDLDLYTYDPDHEFYSSISSAVVGTPQILTGKSVTGGVLDADDVVFPDFTGAECGALLLFIDTGNPATSRLVALIDEAVGLPVMPDGTDLFVKWPG